jgi:hypothetical protein
MRRICAVLLGCIAVLAAVSGCAKQTFEGTRTSDDKRFVLEYTAFTGEQAHELELQQGASIDVTIQAETGRIDIVATGPDGKEIYKGNHASSGSFALEIQQTGTYRFSVTGRRAAGGASFVAGE